MLQLSSLSAQFSCCCGVVVSPHWLYFIYKRQKQKIDLKVSGNLKIIFFLRGLLCAVCALQKGNDACTCEQKKNWYLYKINRKCKNFSYKALARSLDTRESESSAKSKINRRPSRFVTLLLTASLSLSLCCGDKGDAAFFESYVLYAHVSVVSLWRVCYPSASG